ncbi:MAG: PEPxxWA-CTERM sorting domain-containing protein [Pseudomonadota bacterium]
MVSKHTWTAGLAAVALVVSAGAAEAAQFYATYRGVITNGVDAGGKIFGQSDLTGLSYEVTYLVDPSIYTNRSAAPSSPVPLGQSHYQIVGGSGATTPILSVTLTINGVIEELDYSDYASQYADARLEWASYAGGPSNIDMRGDLGREVAYSGGPYGRDQVNFVSQAASMTPIPYELSDGWEPSQQLYSPIPFYFARSWGDSRGGYDFYYLIYGSTTSASFRAAAPGGGETPGGGAGAVPEPATWALMIGGFGMAGATLRRRRQLAI